MPLDPGENMNDLFRCRVIGTLIFLLFMPIPMIAGDCGRKTDERPHTSSTTVSIDEGKVNSVRGNVSLPDGTTQAVVVEVYRNQLTTAVNDLDYKQIGEIINSKRLFAVKTENSGNFCIERLEPGNYMLFINIADGPSQYTNLEVFLNLVRNRKKKSKMKIQFGMAI